MVQARPADDFSSSTMTRREARIRQQPKINSVLQESEPRVPGSGAETGRGATLEPEYFSISPWILIGKYGRISRC
jgi:hypothetical protein